MFEGVPNWPDAACPYGAGVVDKHQVNIFYTAHGDLRADGGRG